MKKIVYFKQELIIGVEVKVDKNATDDEIIQEAYKHFDGVTQYAGNGASHGKIVGVNEENVTIEPVEVIEFEEIL
jgi:hypothetical protein